MQDKTTLSQCQILDSHSTMSRMSEKGHPRQQLRDLLWGFLPVSTDAVTRLSFKQHGIQERKGREFYWVSPVSNQSTKRLGEGTGSPPLLFLSACSLLNWEETLNDGINLQNG